jgi:hypothetical protein
VALDLTQSVTEMCTRKYIWDVICGRRLRLTLTAICDPIVQKEIGILDISESYRPPRTVIWITSLLLYFINNINIEINWIMIYLRTNLIPQKPITVLGQLKL